MATSPVTASIEKRRLKNAPMHINRVRSTNQIIFSRLRCTICSFNKLKKRIHYKIDVPRLASSLCFYKDGQTLNVKVFHEGHNKNIECFMFYDSKTSIKIQETGRYQYKIPLVAIQDSKNQYYDVGWLYLEFLFKEIEEITPAIRPFINAVSDEERSMFYKDLVKPYQDYRSELNISLLLKNGLHQTRKHILAARSKFFYNYLKQNPDSTVCRLDAKDCRIVEGMDYYMSYGCIYTPNNVKDVIDLFMLAVFMQIPSLQSLCEVELKKNINPHNVHQVRAAGLTSGNESLVRAVDYFLLKTAT